MNSTAEFFLVSDEDLIFRILKEKDKVHFKVLYERYYGKVLNKCYAFLKNRDLSAELATDIMARAFEKLDTFKGNSSFSTWLYAITYNNCIDYLREKKKLHYPEWNRKQELPDISDSEEVDESDKISYEFLVELMEKLHTEEKALLLMKYQDELSLKQISESMRITESAVKMRLKRAKTRLLYLYKSSIKDE
ncbi:MAG: RNA polymerase subunit sigma-70 [Bacteroidetes bacterium HGW-Bacteroidetes-17]|jgi:RNA polymerase sigma-70 factor (ECF subfamily)|nr:MAG: RNA polymerase subunit sigma-70 [Bacteroidetes bacterium HGW-Bacteroidetes-17]